MLRLGPKSQISRPAAEHTGDRVTPGHPIWSARIPEGTGTRGETAPSQIAASPLRRTTDTHTTMKFGRLKYKRFSDTPSRVPRILRSSLSGAIEE